MIGENAGSSTPDQWPESLDAITAAPTGKGSHFVVCSSRSALRKQRRRPGTARHRC